MFAIGLSKNRRKPKILNPKSRQNKNNSKMKKLALMVLCAFFTISIYAQTSGLAKTVQKGSNITQVKKQFTGICYLDIQMKPGSDRLADTKMVLTYQSINNCKKYEIVKWEFNISSEPTPCKIVGYIKDNRIFCDSLDTNLDKSLQDSIMMKYNAKCKSK